MSVERTLHHFPLDPASRQVRLALGEKRLAFADNVVRYWEQPKDFLALNPTGVPPVLVEVQGGQTLVICEVRAILEHLDETVTQPPLLGREPAERAEARRLMQWFDRKFNDEVNAFLLHEKLEKRLLKMGAPDLYSMRQGRDALRAHLSYMEKLLQARDWLAGKRLSYADFAAGANISVLDYFGDIPWRDFPAVKTWYMTMKSRPAFRPILADRWPGLAPAGHYDDLDF
ncbi:MAG: glutathione S-transferase family protein [Proteobacteria bacterium]|nr:glutathione S-transferase family protein [Pseudomonadota bacterium]